MSLQTFATATLTSRYGYKRRPAITQGQIARTLILCLLFLIGLLLVAHERGHASDTRAHGFAEHLAARDHNAL